MSKMASGDSIETIEVVEPTLNMNSAKTHSVINESSTEDEGKPQYNDFNAICTLYTII